MTPTREWLRTKEGTQFLSEVVEHTRGKLLTGLSADSGLHVESVGITNMGPTANEATDWDEVVKDFLSGLGSVLGISDLSKVDPGAKLAAALTDAYRMRFHDLYLDGLDVKVTKHQAQTLGIITGNIYRLHKGDIVPDPTHPYPKTDSTLKAPSLVHLQWARDCCGFWAGSLNRFDIGVPNPTPPQATALVEFGNGCTLC